MVAYTREHPAQLKWLKGEPLSKPADKLFRKSCNRRFVLRAKGTTAEDDERWFRIATLATDNIQMTRKPSKMQPVIGPILANGKRRRESFEKAHQLDPKSTAALVALGQISAEMKDIVSARKYYRGSSRTWSRTARYSQTAKAALQKLQKK